MLAQRQFDAVVWISALSDLPPPDGNLMAGAPLVLLGGPGMAAAGRADVYLPIGTPGLDHAGHLVRTDKVVTLRLPAARAPQAPPAAAVLRQILEALTPC
jgi:formylmethanofuran dehydrogenase subunit B